MMKLDKLDKAVLLGGTVIVLLAITLTGYRAWFGALIGFWLSFLTTELLYRDADRSLQGILLNAIRRMRRGLFIRFGIISLVVVGIARFQRAWILSFIVGFAVGIPISLIYIYRRHNLRRKG